VCRVSRNGPASPHGRVSVGDGVVVADLPPSDFDDAIAVLARGMRDNPLHIAAYGRNPDRRERSHARVMRTFFAMARNNRPIGVWRHGVLVACTGVLFEGACRPTRAQSVRMAPVLIALGPLTARRMHAWLRVWREHDPDEPHAHLGPLAVDRHLQGRGLGGILLAEHCSRLDAAGLLGYLETDRPDAVRFYERAGYRVVGEAPTLGVTSWFMRRDPRATDARVSASAGTAGSP
jgi:ribosomal protein S18 acetylase RimI-like enzyme